MKFTTENHNEKPEALGMVFCGLWFNVYIVYVDLIGVFEMKKSEFKVWLIHNGYTQKSLAKRLEITEQTITKYNGLTRYPEIFLLALKALEIKA